MRPVRLRGAARAAVNEQQHRIVSILSPDLHPLFDVTDADVQSLLHAVGGIDGKLIGREMLKVGTTS